MHSDYLKLSMISGACSLSHVTCSSIQNDLKFAKIFLAKRLFLNMFSAALNMKDLLYSLSSRIPFYVKRGVGTLQLKYIRNLTGTSIEGRRRSSNRSDDDIGLITYAFESVFIRHVLHLTSTTHVI